MKSWGAITLMSESVTTRRNASCAGWRNWVTTSNSTLLPQPPEMETSCFFSIGNVSSQCFCNAASSVICS